MSLTNKIRNLKKIMKTEFNSGLTNIAKLNILITIK